MTLTTQDGRTLEISREYRLNVWTTLGDPQKANDVSITVEGEAKQVERRGRHNLFGKWEEFTYQGWEHDVKMRETVGKYPTEVRRNKVANMLRAAWEAGVAEFAMPQNSDIVLTENEQFADFCEEHGLMVVSINELGYKPSDVGKNLRIWQETDEFERRGILVCDPETHGFEKSLAKWQALQRKSNVVPIEPKGYVKRAALRRSRCKA